MRFQWPMLIMLAFPIWATLDYFLGRRAKIIAHLGQQSSFGLAGEKAPQVRTHSLIIANVGRRDATNIRLGHQVLPEFKFLFPASGTPDSLFEVFGMPEAGGKEIVIPVLGPEQQVEIAYLYAPPLTVKEINTYVKSDLGPGKLLRVLPLSQYPVWLCYLGVQFLLILPVVAFVYWAFLRISPR
jgi:hypothetical protein